MSEEIIVNKEFFSGNQEDYDALEKAVKRLSSASEEQFENIKKEKWYNRVFDMVTFSQKGKKRIAEQVGTLAQAQQILIELLTRLSCNDSNVSDIVVKSMEDINRLSEQNIYLLRKIKKLENISLGMKIEMDLKSLSEINKKILSACLHFVCDKTEDSSDDQRKFANQVIKYLNVDVQMDNPLASVNDIDSESKKKILNCCMEYMFLYDCSDCGYSFYDDFISEFDFGNKTRKSIEKQIMSLYKLRGKEGFFSKYQNDNFESVDEFFSLEIDGCSDTECKEEYIEMTDETISSILHISKDDKVTKKNKRLHFSVHVSCEGELIFDHCIIYYNEWNNANIELSEGAKLAIRNSLVICKDKGYPFINCKGSDSVEIEGTSFEDCSNFICGSSGFFSMSKCLLHNCFCNFIALGVNKCVIENNVIIQKGLKEFYVNFPLGYEILIYIDTHAESEVVFNNNLIQEGTGFKRRYDELFTANHKKLVYFYCETATVKGCTVIGINSQICAKSFVKCKFENCFSAIRFSSFEKTTIVDGCVFVNCTDVIETDKDTQIKNCQFISCYGSIIDCGYNDGGVLVKFCQFINTKGIGKIADISDKSEWDYNYHCDEGDNACITFRRSKEKNSNYNCLEKCIFDGVSLKNEFLIASRQLEKPYGDVVAYIEGCDFRHCSTERKSGDIIKLKIKYDKALKKNIEMDVTKVSGCTGLENVNKEGCEATSFEVRKDVGSSLNQEDVGNPELLRFVSTVPSVS